MIKKITSIVFFLIIIFIIFLAVVIFSTTTFAFVDTGTAFTLPELENVSTGEALDFNNLSSLSAKYESNGKAGTIANNSGDPGGKSYGAFQFASNVGSLDSFLIWLYNIEINLYNKLMSARNKDGGYGSHFDSTWIQIANEDQDYFYKLQYNYTKQVYFDVVINFYKARGIDFTKRSKSLQCVIWSTSVQFGKMGAVNIISKQNLDFNDDLKEDANLIKSIYAEKRKVNIYFSSSSKNIRNAVYNRFINEEKDALAMLKEELSISKK
ncbi:MAG: hypothetical protein ABF289_00675 [Clostridiales bacterium]